MPVHRGDWLASEGNLIANVQTQTIALACIAESTEGLQVAHFVGSEARHRLDMINLGPAELLRSKVIRLEVVGSVADQRDLSEGKVAMSTPASLRTKQLIDITGDGLPLFIPSSEHRGDISGQPLAKRTVPPESFFKKSLDESKPGPRVTGRIVDGSLRCEMQRQAEPHLKKTSLCVFQAGLEKLSGACKCLLKLQISRLPIEI